MAKRREAFNYHKHMEKWHHNWWVYSNAGVLTLGAIQVAVVLALLAWRWLA